MQMGDCRSVRAAFVLTAISALLMAVSPSAAAADLGPSKRRQPPPPPPEVYDPAPSFVWTGFYAGAFVGGAFQTWTVDFYRNNNHGHADETAPGLAGGVWVGYNYQIARNWVVGIEADIGFSNAEIHNEIFDNDRTDLLLNTFGSVRARLGYAVDRALFYGTAGIAFANVTNNIQKGRNAGEQVVFEDESLVGFVIGGGIEYAFTNNWVGRAEYLYSNFGTETLYNRDGNRAEFQNEIHLVRVGLSYKF